MSHEPKRKLTPEKLLDAIEEADAADEAERILALSDEALDQELAAEGFDPKAVRRRGQDLAKQAMRASKEEAPAGEAPWATVVPVAPRRPIARRWVMLLAAALVGGGGLVVVGLLKLHPPVVNDVETAPTPNLSPQNLRLRAFDACDHQQWQVCIDLLSAARDMDPAGDADEHVQAARGAALGALQQRDSKPRGRDVK
ncbi:MAG: hypothetical protein M3O46_09805 [Myxococcota bacterium]|nr:hypothetical protein [Myxococcota bacterium]